MFRIKAAARWAAIAIVLSSFVAKPALAAEDYPNRPVQIVVPYPAGGSDSIFRRLAQALSERTGQSFIVLNKPGASTMVATQTVASSRPDGYTLYIGSLTEMTTNPALFTNVTVDPLTELTPISLLGKTPLVVFTNAHTGIGTFEDLLAKLKQDSRSLKIATYGVGSPPDLVARLFGYHAGLNLNLIPYPGGAPALTALTGGEVDLAIATLIPTRSLIKAGTVKPLVISLDERSKIIPDTPTFQESGLKIAEGGAWPLMAPKGLPDDIRDKLVELVKVAAAAAGVQHTVAEMGVVLAPTQPAEMRAPLEQDTKMWADLMPKLGIQKKNAN